MTISEKQGQQIDENKVITPVFRLSFPHLFQQRQSTDGGNPHYAATMIFDPDCDFSLIWKLMQDVATKAHPNGVPGNFKWGLREDHTFDLAKRPEYEGKIICNAKNYGMQPGVIYQEGGQDILDPRELYAGCYCRGVITAFAYQTKGNVGASICVEGVMKVRDGEALASKSDPQKDFAGFTSASPYNAQPAAQPQQFGPQPAAMPMQQPQQAPAQPQQFGPPPVPQAAPPPQQYQQAPAPQQFGPPQGQPQQFGPPAQAQPQQFGPPPAPQQYQQQPQYATPTADNL